ncbi:MAG: hypothetical protein DI551_09720 [Micavibrio aeruginosavorus]|uniref:M23ase beta-sheet core domain-containing protein n=1 Tax=Micavibrio aeruginosavorus TaxID=349221 RepID=A0A2W5MWP3_9BACT|nr:MAG: hypothetical protein DI551_09720 [Micavibrio aeruginosavorus]
MTARERNTQSRTKKSNGLVLAIMLFAALYPVALYAQASSVIIRPPVSGTPSDDFHFRSIHPVTGKPRMHYGTDYPLAVGTKVSTPGTVIDCHYGSGGAGNMATVAMACGVTLVYMHLQTCANTTGTTTVTSGNTGGSTGGHLHFEVKINGTNVDAEEAYGKNLCDEQVRAQLLADAKAKGGGGGGGGTNPATKPPEVSPPGTTVNTPAPTPPVGGAASGMPPVELPPTQEGPDLSGETENELTGCGTDTWTAMVNQAILQTRREMLMNERYIAISTTTRWENRQVDIIGREVTVNIGMGAGSLDGAITNAAESMFEFIDGSFHHSFLGGLLEAPNSPATDLNVETQADYFNCGLMAQVWQQAKCLNVTDQPLFYKFEDLIDNDPRAYPAGYECEDSGITQAMIDTAKGAEVEFSPLVTHYDLLDPEIAGGCAPPVPTGVTVSRRYGAGQISEMRTYTDALCLTAGCSYQNPGVAGLGTCE